MGSGNSQRHHATDVCRVLFADVVVRIKANHFPGDLYRKRCGIKGLDLPDATFALKSCGPENFGQSHWDSPLRYPSPRHVVSSLLPHACVAFSMRLLMALIKRCNRLRAPEGTSLQTRRNLHFSHPLDTLQTYKTKHTKYTPTRLSKPASLLLSVNDCAHRRQAFAVRNAMAFFPALQEK